MTLRVPLPAAVISSVALFAGAASAYDPYDPKNCNGVTWDDKQPVAVERVTAAPHINFIKSPYDDDFKAETCPAATEACRKDSYLVTGDLVLTGKTDGQFACVSFQSPLATKQIWTNGWLPKAALARVPPNAQTKASDWIGTWRHPGGGVDISAGEAGRLRIKAEMTVPTARDFHNGAFKAEVAPDGDDIHLVDQGESGEDCHVRMQRVGPWLLVEDNPGCGGAAVSFTGLYRRAR